MSADIGAAGRDRRRPQLSDEAASYVRNLIMSGRLRPGASVRPEAIGEALDISSTPARITSSRPPSRRSCRWCGRFLLKNY